MVVYIVVDVWYSNRCDRSLKKTGYKFASALTEDNHEFKPH